MSSKSNILNLLLVSGFVASAVAQSIRTDFNCYNANDPISLIFNNPSHDRDDWVAIYRNSNINPNNLDDFPSMWVWACGTQTCPGAGNVQGTITFGPGGVDGSERQSFPLQPGLYRAVLSGGAQPYRARAISNFFVVSNTPCAGGPRPRPRPTPRPISNPVPLPQPTPRPTPQPQQQNPQPQPLVMQGMRSVVNSARQDIKTIIDGQPFLGPKFVRLSFHDCVGGCDGTFLWRNQ